MATDDPKVGDTAQCGACQHDIIFIGPYWDHVGEFKPRHVAYPRKPSPISGLTPDEQRVMDALLAAWEAFRAIPGSISPSDAQKFRDAIHDAQYVLASLAMRRLYPDYWR